MGAIESFKNNVENHNNENYIISWNTNERINERIDWFVGGENNTEINGTKLKDDWTGFYKKYKDCVFEESIIKYQTSGEVTDEGIVLSAGEDKTVIIYKKV